MALKQTAPTAENKTNTFGQTNLLRTHPARFILVIMVLLWITYATSGFRNPLTPITLSDGNQGAAIRQALFSCAALSSLALLFFTRNLEKVITMNRSMLVLSILVPASVLWSNAPALTIKRSVLFLFGLITIYTITYSSRKPVRKMLVVMVSSTAVIAFVSIAIHFAFGQAYTVNPARPGLAGISIHPNTLAPVLSIGLLLSLGLTYHSVKSMLFGRAAQTFLAAGVALATSMTTIMTTLVGCGLYVILASGRYRRGAIQLMIVSVYILCSLIGFSTLKSAAFQATGRDESLSGRDDLWSIIINEGLKSPILGGGFGAFWTEGKGRQLVHTWNPRQSHNAYIDLWLDLGIVGVAFFLMTFHIPLLTRWINIRGSAGSEQRRAIAALYATAISYMAIYALAQSFFLSFAAFPFMALTWITLLIANPDSNCIESEFGKDEAQQC